MNPAAGATIFLPVVDFFLLTKQRRAGIFFTGCGF
jgi:hypothetical protein